MITSDKNYVCGSARLYLGGATETVWLFPGDKFRNIHRRLRMYTAYKYENIISV